MAIQDNGTRDQYVASAAQTVFAYTFEIFDDDDIAVEKNGVLLAKGTNYTVSGVGVDTGGSITLLVGATAGDIMTLYRDMALERVTDYQQNGDFLADEVNDDFDRLWAANQQIESIANIGLRPTIDDTVLNSTNTELAAPSVRGGKALGFTADGKLDYLSGALGVGSLRSYSTLSAAIVDIANITIGDTLILEERTSGLGGGAVWKAVDATVVTENEFNVVTASASISLSLIVGSVINMEQFGLIKDFGAGNTDNTAVVQFCLDYGRDNILSVRSGSGQAVLGNIILHPENDWRGVGRHKTIWRCKSGTTGKWITDDGSASKLVHLDMAFFGEQEAGLTHVYSIGDSIPYGTEGNLNRLFFRDAPNAVLCRINGNVGKVDSITVLDGDIGFQDVGSANMISKIVIVDTKTKAWDSLSSNGLYGMFEIEAPATGSVFASFTGQPQINGLTIAPTNGATYDNFVELPLAAGGNWSVIGLNIITTTATITSNFKQGTARWSGVNSVNCGSLSVGSSSVPITGIRAGTAMLDFPNLVTASSTALNMTITGIKLGDSVILDEPVGGLVPGTDFRPRVISDDTLEIRLYNDSGSDVNYNVTSFTALVISK